MNDKILLVCARATERFTIRNSIFTRSCSQCGQRVMISPSGQRRLKEMKPEPVIICLNCSVSIHGPRIDVWAAPSPEELAREELDVMPNTYRSRN